MISVGAACIKAAHRQGVPCGAQQWMMGRDVIIERGGEAMGMEAPRRSGEPELSRRPVEASATVAPMKAGTYYVYVYIDPRNHEEFYYGKGTGSRKLAHLGDTSDTAKVKRIEEIHEAGVEPIIRVIARGLTEEQALLVEKTLLWKLGKWTTNVATGHYADKFRPHNMLHRELPGYDYENGLYYYNVGDGPHRKWEDYVKFGFISAGQGVRWRDAMLGFNPGDVFAAYLKRKGFVGIGRIETRAQMIRDVRINGTRLLDLPLVCRKMDDNCKDKDLSEYVCSVEWIKTVPRDEAKTRKSPKLYTTALGRASLDGQPATVAFLEEAFGVELREATR